MELSMAEVERLWEQGRSVPLELAPIALWHLNEPQQPIEERHIEQSEEVLGLEF